VDGPGVVVGVGAYASRRDTASGAGALQDRGVDDVEEVEIDRPDHHPLGPCPPERHHPLGRRRLGPVLLLLVLAVVVVAGCEGYVEDGGGGKEPADLATTKAERAAWPDPPKDAVSAKVQRVVDGDTFVATVKGRRERIRVIGVDTPESVDPNRPDEPFGEEASNFAKHHLNGATVRLAGDVEPRDRYGRMLAYVWLDDGTFWNALLAAEGYAQQLTIPPNVTYAGLFRRLVAEARQHDRGLWAQETRSSS
jgi:endonuclease YncB( thermonuclease family)